MSRVVCEELKTESFSNGDHHEWTNQTIKIDLWQDDYGFDSGTKDLFYDLLVVGSCFSYNPDRVEKVAEILEREGFEFEVVN